ncbi:hypothetical protein A3C87_01280 [Candidatus Kaiserbacteria bacterium RIFCSPHIGHO2_02_FULL_49_34]|uniref:Uncharacterized protein n=1 Tax=Candidatus Kaiserbacteria bacterium RIFCSPHIGHO2_02_FULL_49_34 TaxID=1798491 RepID=A0A1F6DL89_9BACT|nr:MAG: hypothetical protein A3C87_01280 [Candidatus Kaiserbacteria bacterium RIFCSPHIGHO2_02_FULL_49_34]
MHTHILQFRTRYAAALGALLALALLGVMVFLLTSLVTPSRAAVLTEDARHELVFYELSPLGEAGGYMMPASCPSGYVESGPHAWRQTGSQVIGWGRRQTTRITETYSAPCTAAAAPTLSLTANPSSISYNSASTLSWSSANATSCTASNGWSGGKALSGSQSTGALTSSRSYTLSCTGAGGTVTRSVTVYVAAAPAMTSINATCSADGNTVSANWSATNATSYNLRVDNQSNPWKGACNVAQYPGDVCADGYGSTSWSAGGAQGNTYNVWVHACVAGYCSSPISRQVTCTPPTPTLTFTGNPTSVTYNTASTLSWSSTNVTSCTASGAWSGSKAVSGSQSTGALTTTPNTYTLTCTGPGGSITRNVTITIPAPTLSFTGNPTSISNGGASTLTWSTANATSCTASGAWSGSKAVSGSQSTGAITTTPNTYTLTCTGPGGSITRDVTVTIPAPTLTIKANPTVVGYGGASTVTWSTTNATACTASGDWTGNKAVSGSQTMSNIIKTPNTYSMTCTGPGGSVTRIANATTGGTSGTSVTIPAPTATLQVRVNGGAWTTAAQTIEPTDTINLQWGSTNASTCNAGGFTAGTTSGIATAVDEPAPGTTKTYTVQCPGATGTSPANASVDVTTRSRLPTLTSSSLIVTSGSTATLTYDLNSNPSCTFDTTDTTLNNVVVSTNGAKSTGQITKQTVYTLECPGGNATIIINIEGDIREQ